ncbi:MAG: hypothetical protein H3C62_09455 [Gemmatimonadaceae bacterium]|nr:hypothetical protein [Gemmatimonadaceae bacterium]
MALPTLLLVFSTPPFLFGFVVFVLIVVVVLTVHRRFPPGAVEDWVETQRALLLTGHQRAGPTGSDVALRDGALSPLDRNSACS